MKLSMTIVTVVFVIIVLVIGIQDSISFNSNAFKVEPAYLNGILTASGILYGLWAIVITRVGIESEAERKKMKYVYQSIGNNFLICLLFLVVSVV